MSDSDRFLKRGKEEKYSRGAEIYKRGDPSSDGDIFYVISGRVEIAPHALPEHKWAVRTGEIFGIEEPYGDSRTRSRTAVALDDTVVYRWNRKAFDDAMGIYQELATQVIRTLSKGLRELNRAYQRAASAGGES